MSDPGSAQFWVRGVVDSEIAITIPRGRRQATDAKVSDAAGRVVFTWAAFDKIPFVTPVVRYASGAGCTVYQIGDVTKTGATFEVRKPKALVLGLVGVAHEVAPGVTVAIKVDAVD
jgi:hypothetical protein